MKDKLSNFLLAGGTASIETERALLFDDTTAFTFVRVAFWVEMHWPLWR
jgi:hypothetical protein